MMPQARDHHNYLPNASYVPGMRQTARPAHFQFALPSQLDLALLDSHLSERFRLVLQPIRSEVSSVPGSAAFLALAFTWRALQLASDLLQAIKIPSFDPGLITRLEADPESNERFSVTCLLPLIDHFATDWPVRSVKLAYRLLFQLADASLPESSIATLLEELDEKFIEPAQQQIVGGQSTIPMLGAAFRKDIPFRHLGAGLYQLGWGARARMVDRSSCELDTAFGAQTSHNKQTAALLLREAGLPAPEHLRVRDVDEAIKAAQTFGFPVVVKPADKDRGVGITVGVSDENGVRTAFDAASRVSSRVLVERYAPGVCHRLVVVGQTVLYTVVRWPKLVEGDGIHTIRQLVNDANAIDARKAKHWRKTPIQLDDDAAACLASQGTHLDSVLPVGRRVFLRRKESSEWGGTPELVTDVHPENLRVAVRAARMLRLHVAGVDLISSDIRRPWYENHAIINEVNFAPLVGNYYAYQRDSLDQLIDGLFANGARVPIEVFVGDEAALDAARARQQQLGNRGIGITTHMWSWSGSEVMPQTPGGTSLFQRCVTMLSHRELETLLIVVQTDELLYTGMPVDTLNRVTIVNERLQSHRDLTILADDDRRRGLIRLLAQLRQKA